MKIQITEKQFNQFNHMLRALKKIAKDYQTPEQLQRNCKGDYGLSYSETLEMAYENLQNEARNGYFKIQELKAKKLNPDNL